MNEVQANGGIGDINARYNNKMEGYTTWMSYMSYKQSWGKGGRNESTIGYQHHNTSWNKRPT